MHIWPTPQFNNLQIIFYYFRVFSILPSRSSYHTAQRIVHRFNERSQASRDESLSIVINFLPEKLQMFASCSANLEQLLHVYEVFSHCPKYQIYVRNEETLATRATNKNVCAAKLCFYLLRHNFLYVRKNSTCQTKETSKLPFGHYLHLSFDLSP